MISINLTLFVQMGIFLTVLFLLNRLLFRPILGTFDERARRVEEAEKKARLLEAETAQRIGRYEAELAQARKEGAAERDRVRKAASEEEEKLLRRMHEETGARLGDLRERIAREYREASTALKADAEGLSREVASRLLGRSVQ